MQSLSFRQTLLSSTPFGRDIESENGLARLHSQPSPCRPDDRSYPSPPMSDSHSPSRRLEHSFQSDRQPYPPPVSAPRMAEAVVSLPPPSSLIFDHRSTFPAQSHQPQRSLYHGEVQPRQSFPYQTGRAVESHSYGGTRVPQNYTYGYPTAGIPPYVGGQHLGAHVQPATMIAPPPNRPNKPARRTKAHVASACVNCKKAHLSCDVQRPCGRCVASGKQDTCKDVQHKKRGRPRLRDDREFARTEPGRQASSQILGAVPVSAPDGFAHQPPYAASHLQTLGRSTQEDNHLSNARPPPSLGLGRGPPIRVGSYGGVADSPYLTGPSLAYQSLPVAFLNLDLVIQKSNQAFQDLVSFLGDVRGRNLGDLVEAKQNEALQHLRNRLREERDSRDPTYMAPITPLGQDPMQSVVESLADRDVEHVSQGFMDRTIALHFRHPSGQYQPLQAQIRLAKTSLYFATLVIHPSPRSVGPPFPTQLPPTSARGSMSAPSTAPPRDFTPQQTRPISSASSTSASPYFSFSTIRTSLPAFSPSSYGGSPSYNYSPTAGSEQGYFPTIQPPSQQSSSYPAPYPPVSQSRTQSRTQSMSSETLRQPNRPARLESLQLPPIRTGAAPLGSPLHLESGQNVAESDPTRIRPHESPPRTETRPGTPEAHKRRRLNIHEVLE